MERYLALHELANSTRSKSTVQTDYKWKVERIRSLNKAVERRDIARRLVTFPNGPW